MTECNECGATLDPGLGLDDGNGTVCPHCGAMDLCCHDDECSLHYGHCISEERYLPEICAMCHDDTEGSEL